MRSFHRHSHLQFPSCQTPTINNNPTFVTISYINRQSTSIGPFATNTLKITHCAHPAVYIPLPLLMLSPEVHTLNEPTRVDVQVPRTTFRADEDIPIYITIPPPTRELVIDQGLRLRNVRAELVRVVKVKREDDGDEISEYGPSDPNGNEDDPFSAKPPNMLEEPPQGSSSKAPTSPLFLGSSYRAVLARSGASCRFHSLRPVKLRFILHQASSGLPNTEYQRLDADAECASITQLTLLHSIAFRIRIHISFVDTTSHTERIYVLSIPVTILPPPAPLPEIAHSIDAAYHKKHDRPPAKTVRADEDFSIPHYSEGEAGPSMIPSGAPPPFEERDAPPPFFTSASSSNRLPTFLESETEIILPDSDSHPTHIPVSQSITGEGIEFGFPPSDQFDGHSEDMQRPSTPPPTLEMATQDTNLTQLADIREPELAIEALGLVIDQHEEAANHEPPPPPPPAMDDPSDPPPSIDSDFRSPGESRQTSPPHSPPLRPSYHPVEPPGLLTPTPPQDSQPTHGHAPPPYLIPGGHGDEEHVTRPPPYVD
ncbi:hypothetical protein BD779DRAFT_1687485 [Infundibulicybe gibba]|nr:hypothetical protein BD779DRAFT_1687485 [Infundibulicybe gibba]